MIGKPGRRSKLRSTALATPVTAYELETLISLAGSRRDRTGMDETAHDWCEGVRYDAEMGLGLNNLEIVHWRFGNGGFA